MSLNILSILNCDTIFNDNHLTVVTSDDLNNSSFIIDTLLHSIGSKAKTKQDELKVFLLLINQNWLNYSIRLTKRYGINMKHLNQIKCLETLDLLSDYNDYTKQDQFDWDQFKRNVFNKIYSHFTSPHSIRIMIIDDVACLLNLTTSQDLYSFLLSLRSVCNDLKISLIIQTSLDYDEQDEEANQIVYSLIDCGQEWFEVKRLKTGYSSKINGHLIIHDFKKPGKVEQMCYQFKHSERLVKIFQSGYHF